MRHLYRAVGLSALVALAGCQDSGQTESNSTVMAEKPTSLAESLSIKYEVVNNRSDEKCDESQTDGLCFRAKLTLTMPAALTANDWTIYFSNMAPVQMDESDLFDITHINGDLHSIRPTASFTGFDAGKVYEIPFRSGFWHLSQSDMMPNYYVVQSGNEPELIQSTIPYDDKDTGLEILPHSVKQTLQDKHFKRTPNDSTAPATAQWLHQENAPFYQNLNVAASVLPTPKSIKQPRMAGELDLSKGLALSLKGFSPKTVAAAMSRLDSLGVHQSNDGVSLNVTKVEGLGHDAYQFTTTPTGIEIGATSDSGAFYGVQTLASLVTPGSSKVPFVAIEDAPRFDFRGMHVDVSRNFKSKEFILQLLEQMAAFKLNKFHFHLADDEGWRLQIPDLPELTDVGAYRCHDLSEQTCLLPQLGSGPHRDTEVNGYYSVDDYKEILEFAAARFIQVIPSMDMPGHSRAAIKSMEARYQRLTAAGQQAEAKKYLLHDVEDSTVYRSIQFYNDNTINACMDSSYVFIGKVIDEIKIMHQQAGNPLTRYHVGADETAGAWIKSAACKDLLDNNVMGIEKAEDIAAYFVERISRMLAERQIEAAGWSDGMGHTNTARMPKLVQSNAWSPLMWGGHEAAHEQANRGWDIVVSSPDALYFDFPYEADAEERGYYWAARRLNTRKVFGFMPENLPAHAEFWKDREENPYEAKDKVPLNKGVKFRGMQGQLWTETVRGDSQASYMVFPRLYALAERAWHQASWEVPYQAGQSYDQNTGLFTDEKQAERDKQWTQFANHLAKKTLPKADTVGLYYRLPTPGAAVIEGVLHANSLYPGLPIEYRISGGDWQKYSTPVAVSGAVEVRTTTQLGDRKGRTLSLN